MKIIDADVSIEKIKSLPIELDAETIQRCIEVLSNMPSAQPEIIRCKDCEYWDTSWQNDYAPNYHYCPLVDGTRRDDFYCADAERRGEITIWG